MGKHDGFDDFEKRYYFEADKKLHEIDMTKQAFVDGLRSAPVNELKKLWLELQEVLDGKKAWEKVNVLDETLRKRALALLKINSRQQSILHMSTVVRSIYNERFREISGIERYWV